MLTQDLAQGVNAGSKAKQRGRFRGGLQAAVKGRTNQKARKLVGRLGQREKVDQQSLWSKSNKESASQLGAGTKKIKRSER